MSRGMKAQQRRRVRRAANRRAVLGVSKAQDQTPETAKRVELVNGRIVKYAPGRRAAVKRALTASGVAMDATYDLAIGSLIERKFYAAQIDAGYTETRRASWPSEGELADHGEVLYRDEHGGVFKLKDGSIVLASISAGWFVARIASPSREVASAAVDTFSLAYPPLYRDTGADGDTVVPITFWTDGKWGPTSRLRMIDSATWGDIDANYTAAVRDELTRLMTDFEPGKDGQLLLWQGPPGTGKTWALRALATEWKNWAEFNYITDPDAFFVQNPSYMVDVLLHDSYESLTVGGDVVTDENQGGKWRVLILEDTGELLSAKAKDAYGQGLSRLLNVVDGMVGQGLRVLAIVTTNDELGELHPAVTRPGRCASQLSFGELTADEASEWLGEKVEEPMTLAQLYAASADAVETEAFADADGDDDGDTTAGPCANCDHAYSMHPDGGACTATGCDCGGYTDNASTASIGEAFVRIRPQGEAAEPVTADGATTPPIPDAHQPGETIPRRNPSPSAPKNTIPLTGTLNWTANLCPEGKATDDGRIFAPDSITWRELPLALMAMTKTADGHDGAEIAGRIDRIWREAGMIRASGVFDTGEFGQEIARLVVDGTLRGVSVDIAPQKVDIAYRSQVVDDGGYWLAEAPEGDESEGPSIADLLLGNPDDEIIYVVREAVLGMATVCPFQAFADATIEAEGSLVSAGSPVVWTVTTQAGWTVVHNDGALVASVESDDPLVDALREEFAKALTASAAGLAPEHPSADWFTAPDLPELTALTVTPEGRIYGHAAPWGFCHIGFPDSCKTAPETATNYAYFHLKEVECDDGSRVPCGTISLDTGHADHSLGRAAAARHYDDTGTAVADVVVGEDEYGIWVAGALRGDVDAETARKLRGASLSGDWRSVNGNLELVALLAVNVPGFPVPRPTASLVASGDGGFEVATLIAAGVHMGLGGMTPEQREQFAALQQDVAKGEWDEIRALVEVEGEAA